MTGLKTLRFFVDVRNFPNFQIFKSKRSKNFYFNVIGVECIHLDPRSFLTFGQCFRAARKWMRDNQNRIYGNE
jgi:hypothetical protein